MQALALLKDHQKTQTQLSQTISSLQESQIKSLVKDITALENQLSVMSQSLDLPQLSLESLQKNIPELLLVAQIASNLHMCNLNRQKTIAEEDSTLDFEVLSETEYLVSIADLIEDLFESEKQYEESRYRLKSSKDRMRKVREMEGQILQRISDLKENVVGSGDSPNSNKKMEEERVYLRQKSKQYARELDQKRKEIQRSGVNSDLTHTNVLKISDEALALETELNKLRTALDQFSDLSTDHEDAQRQYARKQDELRELDRKLNAIIADVRLDD
eukprot:CAMPEP_0182447394 /NCGR_PEP_ID=MMETSP1172-20130603/15577_1 /TAXON_ID=708627 /ORGANISM="Timspurckia oligopyrenoides, Strain CCMP3278" /LENGTH=273 /DNA_ID=CAMNT_0024643817 /DNA_START=189 /DNA_END=1013 /DNA_ORIENTATION=-